MAIALQKLKPDVRVKVMGNHVLVGRLMSLFDVSQKTIYRWVESDSGGRLSNPSALTILSEELNIPADQLFT